MRDNRQLTFPYSYSKAYVEYKPVISLDPKYPRVDSSTEAGTSTGDP